MIVIVGVDLTVVKCFHEATGYFHQLTLQPFGDTVCELG